MEQLPGGIIIVVPGIRGRKSTALRKIMAFLRSLDEGNALVRASYIPPIAREKCAMDGAPEHPG